MDINDLTDFFNDKQAEVSIDFISSDTTDCKLAVSVAINDEEFMNMKYDLSMSEAEGFVNSLNEQLKAFK